MKENTKDDVTDWDAVFEQIDTECELNKCINDIDGYGYGAKQRRKYTEEELHALAELIRRA